MRSTPAHRRRRFAGFLRVPKSADAPAGNGKLNDPRPAIRRAASKTEYESAKRDFLLQTSCRRLWNDWPLVAALLLVLSLIVTGAGNFAPQ
jgi:hypothetical protein